MLEACIDLMELDFYMVVNLHVCAGNWKFPERTASALNYQAIALVPPLCFYISYIPILTLSLY